MRPDLLELLCCPGCQGSLAARELVTYDEVVQSFSASGLVDITPIEPWPVAVRYRPVEKVRGGAA